MISGLKLSENEDFNFDLRLEGTQYLEQGVYVYAPVGGRDVSQTFVGIAEGERNVDVTMGVTVSFDVDENDRIVAKREWSKDSRNTSNGGGGTTPPTDPYTPPTEDIPDPDVPLSDIPDEDVPLAGDPVDEEGVVLGAEDAASADEEPMVLGAEDQLIAATGDSNHMAAGFGGMFAALAGMFMLRRKKEQ